MPRLVDHMTAAEPAIGSSLTVATKASPTSDLLTCTLVPDDEWLVRTNPSATGAFLIGENATEVTTPTCFPPSSSGVPGSGQGEPARKPGP